MKFHLLWSRLGCKGLTNIDEKHSFLDKADKSYFKHWKFGLQTL